jgi:hypothetical protein
MMSTFVEYFMGKTNYEVLNSINIYNFLIITMEGLEKDEDKEKFIKNIRLIIGNTFCDSFEKYLISKDRESKLLNFF